MSSFLLDRIPVAPATIADREIRDELRRQIASLETDLPPGAGNDVGKGARILTVEELEQVRDDLVRRIQDRRFTAGEEQEQKRRLREEVLLDPAAHRGVTVSNEEVGEPGCTRWTSWFRLKISGGCP
jgi:polyhydroxyalkanoate synthesis regulator phasin